ncbi:hypothetical protein NM688_g3571 [Phlebia brevispora]|uniref:Uncharacterized protein n=1 Tax=Phlebia brevispora TaxID=194682 RepID=A0ACC1T568_9APHY|nr:hypothetical protein NM688_g3571 [Phlebia brevispora]
MDIALEVGDCDALWAPDGDGKWTVSGGAGFTGFAVGPPPAPSTSTPPIQISPSSPRKPMDFPAPTRLSSAGTNSLSTASLLRAPLPSSPNPGELSFDESPNETPLSSIGSLATIPSDPERRSRASSAARHTDTDAEEEREQRPPKVPITIHLNMNELGPPAKNEFAFSVCGTIMLRPRDDGAASPISPMSSGSGSDDESEPSAVLPIPQFRVLHADQESCSTILLNETNSTSLDIYNSTGNIADPQSRKTVVQPGGKTKCGSDGGRFGLRTTANRPFLRREESRESLRRPPSRPRTPSYLARNTSTTSFYRERQSFSVMMTKPKRDGPLMIPAVSATITPLTTRSGSLPTEYAVRISLPAPSETDSEWLEFGLAQPTKPVVTDAKVSHTLEKRPPHVEVASASIEGVPVHFETSATVKPDPRLPALGLTFEETSAKEWITWVKVHVGEAGGGNVQVVYLVKADHVDAMPAKSNGWKKWTGKGKLRNEVEWDVLLPTFSLPVGTMEVNIENQPDVEYAVKSNLTHQQATSSGLRLLQYSLGEFFYPNLTISMSSDVPSSSHVSSTGWRTLGLILCMVPTAVALLAMTDKHVIGIELAEAHRSLESCSVALQAAADIPDPEPVTVTATRTVFSTIYTASPSQAKWWNAPGAASEAEAEKSAITEAASQPPSLSVPTSSPVIPTFSTIPPASTSSPPSKESEVSVVRDMPFLWPIRFDVPSLEIPETARIAATTIWRGVGIVWYLIQRVIHYPLDPP